MEAVLTDEEFVEGSDDIPLVGVKDGSFKKCTTASSACEKKKSKRRKLISIVVFFAAIVLVLVSFAAGLLSGYLIGIGNKPALSSSLKASICDNPPVLLISLDGFRYDYLDRGVTPNIVLLANEGVRAESMRPSFPSKTFPNHFTLVTGLYPEQHGIVSNNFYDRDLDAIFGISSPEALDPKWWLGEPIWVTAHNAILKTAVYFWPGSEVPINGILPDVYFKYNKSVSYEERINTVLSWFDLPDRNRPQFMASYFEEPDGSGHNGGPDSELVNEALRRVDGVIKSYVDGLKERDIYDCVNIVLVSDHGMAATDESVTIALVPDLIPEEYYEQLVYTSYGVFCSLFIKNESDFQLVHEIYDRIFENLLITKIPADVYLRHDAPPEYNIGQTNKQRYGDIFIIPRVGAYIKLRSNIPSAVNIGTHGYNNSAPEMATIFIARGPSFKSGTIIESFQNIEVYNLLCDILDIRPSSNNGTIGYLKDALRQK